MKDHYDPWYVRLPDGRIVKAKSTSSVRHHVEGGNIPLNSMARRTSDEEWVGLTWLAEFADLAGEGRRPSATPVPESAAPPPTANGSAPEVRAKGGVSARLDPMRLQTVGIRGLVDELIAAFDSTVSTGKLVVAAAVAVAGALGVYLVMRLTLLALSDAFWLAEVLGGLAGVAALSVLTALLTRQTHLEISTMRPVLPAEARAGVGPFVLRVFLGCAATFGVGVGVLILLGCLPEWTAKVGTGTVHEIVQTVVWVVGACVAVLVFVAIMLGFLLAPIFVVEECSLGDAIREWRSILREHRLRVMIYEGMALALAVVAALPVVVPVELALRYGPAMPAGAANWVGAAVPYLVHALAVSPALAFLAVANLFIYLNLRYEYAPTR